MFTYFFLLTVNKLIKKKMQNISSLKVELSGFIKYSLNKLDQII